MFDCSDEKSLVCGYIKPKISNFSIFFWSFVYGFGYSLISKNLTSFIISTIIFELIIMAIQYKFPGHIDYTYRYVLAVAAFAGWFVGKILLNVVGIDL